MKIADEHGIKTLFVLFDDCWLPEPKAGKQPAPVPSVHNSGWLKSPGVTAVAAVAAGDEAVRVRLEKYVKAVEHRWRLVKAADDTASTMRRIGGTWPSAPNGKFYLGIENKAQAGTVAHRPGRRLDPGRGEAPLLRPALRRHDVQQCPDQRKPVPIEVGLYPSPTGQAFNFLRRQQMAWPLACEIDNGSPLLRTQAAWDPKKQTLVLLSLNLSSQPRTITFDISGVDRRGGTAQVESISALAANAVVKEDAPSPIANETTEFKHDGKTITIKLKPYSATAARVK